MTPMNIINQYSYVLIGLGTAAILYVVLRQYLRLRPVYTLAVLIAVIALFVTGFFALRPGLSNVDSVSAATATINNGHPTFVEFFSNYCTGCLALNPVVNSLIQDIKDDFDVLQIDIHTSVGRELRTELGFSFTPEFVLYDPSGEEVWRDHVPPTQAQLDLARAGR
jgi:thiol-disulfide isomerase/thioredoxin